MQNKKIEYFLLGVTFFSALMSFIAVYRAIKIPNTSVWLVPMLWISVFLITLLLANVLAHRILEVEIVAACSLLLSSFFAINLWHFVVALVCVFLLFSSLRNTRNDLELNVKISLWKSFYTGKFKMILALALLIASQYYFTVLTINGPLKIPKFDLGSIAMQIAKPILEAINPQYKEIAMQNDAAADEIVAPLGDTADKYFNANISGSDRASFFPLILAAVLFLTIWPLGSILSVFWFWIAIVIFKVLVKFEVVKIEKVMVERERIV